MAALHKNRGFTLVELMVVVGIILIITGATIPSLTSYMRNQGVRQAQQQLVSDMRSTQVKALTGTRSDEEVGGSAIRYWGIDFTVDSSDYNIIIDSTNTDCNGDVVQTETLPNSVVTKTSAAHPLPNCILFEMLNGDISIPGSSDDERSVVVGLSSANGSDKEAVFNRMGLIYAED